MQRSGKAQTGLDRPHDGLPVVGGARPRVLGGTAMRPRVAGLLAFFCDFSFIDGFCWFLPVKLQCIWTYSAPNSTPFHNPFHPLELE